MMYLVAIQTVEGQEKVHILEKVTATAWAMTWLRWKSRNMREFQQMHMRTEMLKRAEFAGAAKGHERSPGRSERSTS